MVYTHAETYKGFSPHNYIHKARLRKIYAILKEMKLQKEGKWGDFGCSDGFYLYYMREKIFGLSQWEFYGFDHDDELLSLARKRNIHNATFLKFDLNKITRSYENFFDIVTCFETIEHTGSYKNAFENIYLSSKQGGYILLSVPNEIGLPGLIKFIGRKLLRKNPYESFFEKSSEWKYFIALLRGKDIEVFRNKEIIGWGPHLGFNYRNFEKYVFEEYLKKEKCGLIKKDISFLGFNILYFLRKI